MGVRQFKPVTPGRRQMSVSDFSELTDRRRKPEKSLLRPLVKSGGRNNQGIITTRFRGGGHKRRYRLIDFKRSIDGVVANVIAIEYDPNRSARIALVEYANGTKSYILAPQGLKAGDKVESGESAEPGRGGQMARSAGCSAVLTAREGKWAQVTLPSGEMRRVPSDCRATIGVLGNADHMNISLGKAGRKRWLGRKPHNRGVSMNPVNHPMGGGEGRTAGGRHPCSPTGVLAKGGKTRKKRKPGNKAIIRRRRPGPRGLSS